MLLSDEAIEEFITICEEEHGVRLTKDEAIVRARQLYLLYELLHRPLPGEVVPTPPTPPPLDDPAREVP